VTVRPAGTDPGATGPDAAPPTSDLEPVLRQIAGAAAARDEDPSRPFPTEAFAALRATGVLTANAVAGGARPPAAGELALVRRVAAADGSVGRILDGHLNAVERLAVQAPPELRDAELGAVRSGRLLAGVWGGNPREGEGAAATVTAVDGGEVLRGVKTFCSGAGGLQRAAVVARAPDDERPLLVWIDLGDARCVEIDTSWYRSRGLVASASHRVVFHDAPVLARLGEPGAIAAQPWFGRDALRTAASWAGIADSAVAAATAQLAAGTVTELESLAAGRILAARHTIDVWLAAAADAMDDPGPGLGAVALNGRVAIADACRTILDEAARACGSHPFAHGGDLDRARRDLEVFLLQHRLDPMVARAGRAALTGTRP
jgi:alkylation response protein AidB-like acyl-CoA dehydrogenase